MFANCQLGGQDFGFPDVCLTPPTATPLPYPNIALGPTAVDAVYNVLISAAPAHNLRTSIPLTNGDNAGVLLGVASGTVMGPARHVTASVSVLMGGMPATRLTSMSIQNSTNVAGCRIAPSQVKVILLGP
jgi:uncharacterized protein DUF4150